MNLVVAIREQSASKARDRLSGLQAEVIKSRFDAQDPALRNLLDGLVARGLEPERDGSHLYWYLLASPLTVENWLAHETVAVCFSHQWFQQQSLAIRYLKGVAYCDAAAGWAAFLSFERIAPTLTAREGELDWRGLPVIAGAEGQGSTPVVEAAADNPVSPRRQPLPAVEKMQSAPDTCDLSVPDEDAASQPRVKPERRLSLKKKAGRDCPAADVEPAIWFCSAADTKPVKKPRQRKSAVREQEEQLDLFG